MLLYFILLSFAISQFINLAASDLSDALSSVTGWSAITSGGTTVSPYNSISSSCNNQNMLILNNNYLTYQKTYTITDYEFYQLFIEFDIYFYQFTQTTIDIIVNTQTVYSQQFTSSKLTLNNICGTGSDSQYTIFQGFYTTQQTLQIQIQYIQNIANTNSFIGIKNLNIYSNGIPLIGGCPMNTPLLQAGTCVTQCTTTNPYLTGQYWNQCASGANAGSGFKYYYQTNVNNFQFYSDASPVDNSNIYISSIFHSNVFSSLYQRSDPYYGVNLAGIGVSQAVQLNFIFYIFGEWNDGSYVSLFFQGASIYANNMITISKTNGQYYSSTQSLFYRTNVTQSGVGVVALKTLIGFSGRFYQAAVQMYFKQVLFGSTASYGYGNIVVYRAVSDPNILSTDMYGFPFACNNLLFAYNGSCVSTCPVYSFTSTANKNCTDYSSSESYIYNQAIPVSQNAYGTYVIKQFYQNNFQQSYIDSLFKTKPPTLKNYLNSESFSFIQSKKILGGYYSWGYGTYQATFSNLIAHFQVRFFFTLYLIDGWQAGDTFTYQVDGTVVDTYTANPTLQYQGLSTLDTIHVISGRKVSHGSSTLTISFNCNIAQKDSSKASCGIQNLFVLIDQNVNILCPLNNQFFSYTTQNCETCAAAFTPCQLFPSNGITAKCSIGCLTCTSSTVCTVCDTSNGYQLSGNVCICLSNYIMISSICQKCYYQCTTCSGTASNQCNTCDATRTISSNTCPCNANYYDVQSITPCAAITSTCHYSCSTCFGLQYYQCLTCPSSSNRTFQSTSNTCPCDSTYSDNGVALCVSASSYTCDISCLTCNAAGNTSCLSCDSTKYRTNLSSGQCPCDLDYNDALDPGNACVPNYTPCHYSCLTCYGASDANCLTCSSADFRTLSSNQCPCDNGYINLSFAICKQNYSPCIYSCLTCFGALITQCITCPATRSLTVDIIGGAQRCLCQDGLYDNNVATCATCDSTCKKCTAAGSNSCSLCDSTQNRTQSQSGTTCPCSSGYNDILSPGNSCVANYAPCHFSCLTCYQSLSNNCLTCDGSNNRTYQSATKICQCDANYSDIGVATCLINFTPCHNDCLTCYGPASSQCSSCGVGRTINIVTLGVISSCPCSTNYYYASGSSCLGCESTCLSCNGGSNNNCTSCDSSVFRQQFGTTCICQTGYNELLNPGTCVINYTPCHSNCLTCFGSANNQCINCKDFRTIISNTCPCSDGFNEILNPGTCVQNYTPCHEQCKTCYGGLNNNCITCDPANYRIFDSNSNDCPCNYDYIDLGWALCVSLYSPCYTSCDTCFGELIDQCVSCPSTRTLNLVSIGHQSCDCDYMYYEVNGDQQCYQCHYSCATCTGESNLDCLSCNAGRNFSSGQCPCSTDHNDLNGTPNDCKWNYSPCHYSCDTCFGASANQCVSCGFSSTHRVYQTDYTCPCENNYIEQNFQQICLQLYSPCHFSCNQCIGPTLNDCADCSPTSNRIFNAAGQCQCNSGYNDAQNQQTCQLNYTPCDITCGTCFGGSSAQCLTCSTPLVLFGGTCQCPTVADVFINNLCYPLYTPCHYSCLNCIDNLNTGCYQCFDYRIFQITGLYKVCVCSDRYFEDASNGNICTQCHHSCLTCQTTQQNCLTCSQQDFRTQMQNTCPCIQNYNDYLDSQQKCVQDLQICHYSCQTCYEQQKNQCLSCPLQSQRLFEQFQCNCADGYFDSNQPQCHVCDFKCELCQHFFDNCIQCNKDHFRYLSTNKCICLDGFYDNNVPICQPCNQDCKICDKNQCLQCKSDQRQLINGQCSCYDGYYLLDQKCYQCENQCLTCIGSPNFQCLTCGNNRILINNQCECIKGYFSYYNNCLSCSIKEGKQYKECQYLNYNDGVWTPGENCDDGNMIPRDGCTELNIDNGYQCDNKLMTPSICYQCPDNCQKCLQSNNKVQCINCIQNYFENQSYCYDENCITCLNHSYCSKCLYNIQAKNGKCIMCEQGYKQQGKTCLSICGDGIRTSDEECDDNNQYNNDGCSSQCKIEQGYICNPQCRLEQNDIKAKLLKSGNQTNNIQIEILNYIFDLTQLEIKIDLLSIDQDYQFNISSINQNKFEIKFIFYKPIKSFNIIHVYLPIKQNQRLLDYIVREMQVIPEEADYYDTTQQSQRQTIQTTQQQFYQSLLYIGPIAFLLGGTSFFIQILDILSWINNFYYINVNYPGNVQIFFQQSNWGLLFSLPQIFQFEIQDNNSQLPQKFQDKGVDSLILNNIQYSLLILIIIICCIPLSKYIQNQIKRYSSKNFKRIMKIKIENELMGSQSQIKINQNQQQQHKCNYFIQTLSNQLQDFYINRYAILLKTINLNILDIILAIMINLKYQSYFNEILQIICFILCLMMTILCITYFYCLYFIAYLHQTLFRLKFFKNLSKELFEGIKSDKISRFYGFQSIFQKSLFIIFIVLFFERPLQQTLFCSSVLSGLIVVSTYQYPFKMKKDLLTQFIPDILLAIILLFSTILAADEQFNELSFYSRYNIGWIIIGLIGISILIQIVFILKEAFQQILIKFQWIKSMVS